MATSGDVAAEFVRQQLDREEQRRQGLHSRAAIVLSGAGAAVAALFAALTYAYTKDKAVLGGDSRWFMYLGLIGFGVAVLLALGALVPRRQALSDVDDVASYMDEDSFREPASYADRNLALATLGELRSLRQINNYAATLVLTAQLIQAVSIVLVAVAIACAYG
jgi:hypothetical protein